MIQKKLNPIRAWTLVRIMSSRMYNCRGKEEEKPSGVGGA